MRNGILGALGVWLTGATLAFAQSVPAYRPATGFYYPAPAAYGPVNPYPGGTWYPSAAMYPQGYPQAYPVYPAGQWVRPVSTLPAQLPPVSPTSATARPMPRAEDQPVTSEVALPAPDAAAAAPAATTPAAGTGGCCDSGCNAGKEKKKFAWKLGGKKGAKCETACEDTTCDDAAGAKKKSSWKSPFKKKDKGCAEDKACTEEEHPLQLHETPQYATLPHVRCAVYPLPCDDEEQYPVRVWGVIDGLAWRIEDGHVNVPLLASSSGVLLGPTNLDYDVQYGARFRGGVRLGDDCYLEGSAFGLGQNNATALISSTPTGIPMLFRPITDAATGAAANVSVATPGTQVGTFSLNSSTQLYGGDLNIACTGYPCENFSLSFLFGARYLNLKEDLLLRQISTGTTTFTALDFYNGDNQFYGGQIGLQSCLQCNRLFFTFSSKVAVGDSHVAVINRGTSSTTAGVGVLTSGYNRRSDDTVAYVPEGSFEVGYMICPRVSLLVGWNFLYWSQVARPGEQVTNFINVPVTSGQIDTRGVWVQGATLSLGFRY